MKKLATLQSTDASMSRVLACQLALASGLSTGGITNQKGGGGGYISRP
jgi:hypothetical protein